MAEVFAAKRQATTDKMEEQKQEPGKAGQETVEERRARLLAQRDALREAKKKQMQDELQTFNEKTKTKDTLFDELKKMDAQKGKPAQLAAEEQAALDKRRAIMRGVKQQIVSDERDAQSRQDRERAQNEEMQKSMKADALHAKQGNADKQQQDDKGESMGDRKSVV